MVSEHAIDLVLNLTACLISKILAHVGAYRGESCPHEGGVEDINNMVAPL